LSYKNIAKFRKKSRFFSKSRNQLELQPQVYLSFLKNFRKEITAQIKHLSIFPAIENSPVFLLCCHQTTTKNQQNFNFPIL